MTNEEALGAARVIWAPYALEAERLGFMVLEERVWEWTEHRRPGHSAQLFLYREPTFLDFYVTVPDGPPPPGILKGFGGIQLYTFFRAVTLQMALTNGSPPHAPRSFVTDFFDRLFDVPEDHHTFRMRNGAADLQAVIDRHRRVIGRSSPFVPVEPLLEQRWKWMKEIENENEPCC